ncbi:hypothetical protein [Gordonia alkaliphila]|uniref:Uncharacterized protein n=1 Tax=Gordonia alkaliphila TaxID=1053547 RepID=A0ABP8Z003_9ACTN
MTAPEKQSTELGVRSLVRVFDDPAFVDKVHQQIYSWCKAKRWDAELLTGPGSVAEIAEGVTASLVGETRQDGSLIERYRFYQRSDDGTFITQITNVHQPDGSGWIWTDLQQPTGFDKAAVPKVVRQILEVTDGRDGSHHLTPEPASAHLDDVDEIYAALLDPDRRGHLYLSGASAEAGIPLPTWTGYVGRLLAKTRGLASAYVLDAEATEALNSRLPEKHQVGAWTIRTFLPQPELDDPRDGLRHRVLTTARIADDPPARLSNILGRAACRHSTTAALPRELIRIDRALREQLDDAIVDQVAGQIQPTPSAPTSAPKPTPVKAPIPPREEIHAEASNAGQSVDHSILNAIRDVLDRVVGKAEVTVENIVHLGKRAGEALTLRDNLSTLRTRLGTVQAERNDLEDQNAELNSRAEDSQLELAVARLDLAERDTELRHLRSELAKQQAPDTQWVPETDPRDTPPDSFEALLARLSEFPHLDFTGDEKHTLELDVFSSSSWPIGTWTYLRALDDYCRVRSSGEFNGSIADYVAQPPVGCVPLTPGSHVPDETPATQNRPEFRRQRVFPVPTSIAASGEKFMGEHIRIASYGMISPRMHLYNDATKSGRIYIGYIGKHLKNFRTN